MNKTGEEASRQDKKKNLRKRGKKSKESDEKTFRKEGQRFAQRGARRQELISTIDFGTREPELLEH